MKPVQMINKTRMVLGKPVLPKPKLVSGDYRYGTTFVDEQNAHVAGEPCGAKARSLYPVIAPMKPVHLTNRTRIIPENPVVANLEVVF